MEDASPPRPSGFSYEVFGKVQGVFFRKHTQRKASELGLAGWCLNSDRNTVQGEACGNAEAIAAFSTWLSTVGSPKSKIKRAEIFDIDAGDLPLPFEIRK